MNPAPDFATSHAVLDALKSNFSSVVIGQQQAIDDVLVCVAAV